MMLQKSVQGFSPIVSFENDLRSKITIDYVYTMSLGFFMIAATVIFYNLV